MASNPLLLLGARDFFAHAIEVARCAQRVGSDAVIRDAFDANYNVIARVIANGVDPLDAVAAYRDALGDADDPDAIVAVTVAKTTSTSAMDLAVEIEALRMTAKNDADLVYKIVTVLRRRSDAPRFALDAFALALLEPEQPWVKDRFFLRVRRSGRTPRRAVRLSAVSSAGSGADGPPEPSSRPTRLTAALVAAQRSTRGPPRARGPPCAHLLPVLRPKNVKPPGIRGPSGARRPAANRRVA